MSIYTRFSFHPIGQGTFASGFISLTNPDKIDFRWVYDCGAVKKWVPQLNQEIARFARHSTGMGSLEIPSKQWLELVFISHFDSDHISGLVRLLQTFSIETLVLPYVPLWQRVVAGISSRGFDNPRATAFLANPIAFIASIEGANVRRILLVPPSTGTADRGDDNDQVDDNGGGDGPTPQRPSPESPNAVRVTRESRIGPTDAMASEDDAHGAADNGGNGTIVTWLEPGGRILAPGGWEFVPYNDPVHGFRATANFRLAVRALAKDLLTGTPSLRANALAKLKARYTAQFGKSAKQKNGISLFVYGGPTFLAPWDSGIASFPSLAANAGAYSACDSGQCVVCSESQDFQSLRPSILYTGDGYLKTAAQVNNLTEYLGHKRVANVGTLQVMHHGSRGNCHKSVASTFDPLQSVFCADKSYHYRHPHDDVWKMFQASGGVLVDSNEGLTIFQNT